MQQFLVDWPPSVNQLWRAYHGRNILSARARQWFVSASKQLAIQKVKPTRGQVEIGIDLCAPHNRRYDPDNRVKALLDLLVKNGILDGDDDSIITFFSVRVVKNGGFAGASITVKGVTP